jgi:hypothetical protein
MFRKLCVAVVAALGLAVAAPAAIASAPAFDCGFDTVSDQTLTGGANEGVAYGYAMRTNGDTAFLTIRCYIQVNGVELSSTQKGSGDGVAQTVGRVTFTADEGADVEICAEVETTDGEYTLCLSVNSSATGGPCNGAVDANCDDRGQNCTLWVAVCVVG